MFDYCCTHVLGSVGSQDTGQQLGLAAFAIISAVAQSAELGPGPRVLGGRALNVLDEFTRTNVKSSCRWHIDIKVHG